MTHLTKYKEQIIEDGFTIIENVYSDTAIESIIKTIDNADTCKPAFRKANNVFAIRRFLKEMPGTVPYIFTKKFKSIINEIFGEGYFVVKSIYFDKPGESNWFVSYHQDLTISVEKKIELEGFGPWSVKQNQFAVQPPLNILKTNFTIRIHLDNTHENNGALRVIPKSHLKDIYRPETIDWTREIEIICNVSKGGIMIMRPLLLHTSRRTANNKKRRVIHIEFSNKALPEPLCWSELLEKGTTFN